MGRSPWLVQRERERERERVAQRQRFLEYQHKRLELHRGALKVINQRREEIMGMRYDPERAASEDPAPRIVQVQVEVRASLKDKSRRWQHKPFPLSVQSGWV